MFDRLARSWQLARDTWAVLRSNKRFMIFPLLSGIACILVLLSFIVPLWAVSDKIAGADGTPPWLYVVIFLYYIVNYFVIIFFNAALVHCSLMKFSGEDPTVGDGIRAAAARLPQILAWAVVSATVGMLLKAIENAHEKAGYWISLIIGTAWTILTFFVVPVLVVEKAGPFTAISRSTSLMKKTWGEALIGHIGMSLFAFVLFLPILLLMLATGFLWVKVSAAIGVAMLIVTLLAILAWAAVVSALNTVYLSALYQYAAFDQVPQGYSEETLRGAFGKKTA